MIEKRTKTMLKQTKIKKAIKTTNENKSTLKLKYGVNKAI